MPSEPRLARPKATEPLCTDYILGFFLAALDDLRNHLENPDNLVEMKFLLLEQKYLEHLSRGNSIEALKVRSVFNCSWDLGKDSPQRSSFQLLVDVSEFVELFSF